MPYNTFKKLHIDKGGFTLVETLVALMIFSVSILSVMSVLASGISNTTYAKQKTTGGYLAQEGIEYARNMRDTFVLYDAGGAQSGWDAFVNYLSGAGCDGKEGCYFDNSGLSSGDNDQPMTRLQVYSCSGDCPNMYYESSTGKYGYRSGEDSGYSMRIHMTQISADEVLVYSTVNWKKGSGNYSTTFTEHLFNWVE